MPKVYEDIRNSYLKHGKSLVEAKRIAAMTYNKLKRLHKNWAKLSNKPDKKGIKIMKSKLKKK